MKNLIEDRFKYNEDQENQKKRSKSKEVKWNEEKVKWIETKSNESNECIDWQRLLWFKVAISTNTESAYLCLSEGQLMMCINVDVLDEFAMNWVLRINIKIKEIN